MPTEDVNGYWGMTMIAAYLDSVYCTYRNPGYRYTRKDVAADLEHAHGKGVSENGHGRLS